MFRLVSQIFIPFNSSIVVEDLHRRREPLPTMEAIYMMTPSEEAVQILMRDFEHPNRPMYKAAHIYFTEGNWYMKNSSAVYNFFQFKNTQHIIVDL